jgi:hypothetical protein
MALPETLRSEILKSYGRDEFANYRRNIDRAIGTWRQLGVWRVRGEAGGSPATATKRASVALRTALSIDGVEFRQAKQYYRPTEVLGASAARPASKVRGTVTATVHPGAPERQRPPEASLA